MADLVPNAALNAGAITSADHMPVAENHQRRTPVVASGAPASWIRWQEKRVRVLVTQRG